MVLLIVDCAIGRSGSGLVVEMDRNRVVATNRSQFSGREVRTSRSMKVFVFLFVFFLMCALRFLNRKLRKLKLTELAFRKRAKKRTHMQCRDDDCLMRSTFLRQLKELKSTNNNKTKSV